MRSTRGFTIVELMVTVLIVALLSVVAGTAYVKYFARARASEVASMFGEIRNKEEAYRAEFSYYLTTSQLGSETDFYPALPTGGGTPDGEPMAKPWLPTLNVYPMWYFLGVHPGKTTTYCGYNVVACDPTRCPGGSFPSAAGTWVKGSYNNIAPLEPWWVALAMCDNDGTPSDYYSGKNATYATWYNNVAVASQNETR